MKKIDWYILRSFFGPLLLTFTLADFVLLMQFLWKYIDDLVGKGLDISIILELMLYASATFVPMALPIATLFASIMVMGNLGEKYELVAMKAAGISLQRIMLPIGYAVLVLTFVAFFFANWMMPYANYKFKSLRYDIVHTKPALNIKPNEYYTGIEGFVIRINKKEQDGKVLKDIIIYDHSKKQGNTSVTVAKKGAMFTSKDGKYLTFNLFNGYNYSEELDGNNYTTRPLNRIYFKEQSKRFDLSSFGFIENDNDFYKNHYEMMNLAQLKTASDTIKLNIDNQRQKGQRNAFVTLINYVNSSDSLFKNPAVIPNLNFYSTIDSLPQAGKDNVKQTAMQYIRNAKEEITFNKQIIKNDSEYYRRHLIEMHRKFSLPFACVLFFLAGAPFGSIVRKGGLGVPLVASISFFVFYYIISMICERAIREGVIAAWVGMWFSAFIMLPLGIFLTYKAATDSPLLDWESWEKRFSKIFGKFKKAKK